MNIAITHIFIKIFFLFLLLIIYWISKIFIKKNAKTDFFKVKWAFFFLSIVILLLRIPSFLNDPITNYYLKEKTLEESFQYYRLNQQNTYLVHGNNQGFVIIDKELIHYVVNAQREQNVWKFEQVFPTYTKHQKNSCAVEIYKGVETTLVIIEINPNIISPSTIKDSLNSTIQPIHANTYFIALKNKQVSLSDYALFFNGEKVTFQNFYFKKES